MSEAPEQIWAWAFNRGWKGGYYREDKNAVSPLEEHGAEYTRTDTIPAPAAIWREAMEAAAAMHEEAAEHDQSGMDYSDAAGIPISNYKELKQSAELHQFCASAIRLIPNPYEVKE